MLADGTFANPEAAFKEIVAKAMSGSLRIDLDDIKRSFIRNTDVEAARTTCLGIIAMHDAALVAHPADAAGLHTQLARIRNILEQRAAGPALALISYGYRGGSATCFPLHHFLLSGRDAAGDWRPRPPRPWSELAAEEQAVVRDALRQPSDDDAGWEFRTDFRELPVAEYDSAALQAAAMVLELTLRRSEQDFRFKTQRAGAARDLLGELEALIAFADGPPAESEDPTSGNSSDVMDEASGDESEGATATEPVDQPAAMQTGEDADAAIANVLLAMQSGGCGAGAGRPQRAAAIKAKEGLKRKREDSIVLEGIPFPYAATMAACERAVAAAASADKVMNWCELKGELLDLYPQALEKFLTVSRSASSLKEAYKKYALLHR